MGEPTAMESDLFSVLARHSRGRGDKFFVREKFPSPDNSNLQKFERGRGSHFQKLSPRPPSKKT